MTEDLPLWAGEVVETAAARSVQRGVLRCLTTERDAGIEYYRSIGGAHMHERAAVSFAMTALDTVVYREYLSALRPPSLDALIVDVGGGDGRNAWPWLEWGYKRVVVIDPIISALDRFRSRVAEQRPEWLNNLLLIEANARRIPLVAGCAARVQAIEALYYLNEAYEDGLRECARVLSDSGQLLVSERDYEGGLLMSLLYGSLEECLAQAESRDVWDGTAGLRVRSRCFTADELDGLLTRNKLRIVSHRGISALSLVLGYLRSAGKITNEDEARIDDVHGLLRKLGPTGSMRRCHVVVAEKNL
ncbi:MAG TPA: class I SAM-dependent methyltransferase [Candidatus Rubrimentiphilum sp.]|nr:class I SAM-dependent methyltransferase [Candidatus Rubrimentiphilum sp.]